MEDVNEQLMNSFARKGGGGVCACCVCGLWVYGGDGGGGGGGGGGVGGHKPYESVKADHASSLVLAKRKDRH